MIPLKEDMVFARRYRLIRKLGIGGFSEVWLANDEKSGLQIALKIFSPGTGIDEEGQKAFSKEYAIVFDLHHQSLLKPMHFDDWQDMPYLVMQYMPNGNCQKICGKINEKELAKFMVQIAGALAYLHNHKPPIVHEDIKPENILIDDNKVYFLTDFGISTKIRKTLTKSMGAHSRRSSGTTAYMAPERFSKKLSDRAPINANDIFSFGVTLFELLTGEVPYGEMGGIVAASGLEPAELPDTFSENLRQLIASCLLPDPWERPTAAQLQQSATSFINTGEWQTFSEKSSHPVTPPSPPPTKPIRNTIIQDTKPPQTKSRKTVVKEEVVDSKVDNERKSNKYLSVIVFFVMLVFIFIVILISNSKKADWKTAQEQNTIESYQQYLADYPQGEHIAQAEENIAWQTAEQENNIEGYTAFINQYPKGRYIIDANIKLTDLVADSINNAALFAKEDQAAYTKAKRQDTKKAYQKYLTDYPQGQYAKQAKQQILYLNNEELRKADDNAWNKAQRTGTRESYQSYLADYPQGQYVKQAKRAINDIKNGFGYFTDSRDGKRYKWVKIGTQIWMAENLNYTGNNGYQRHITDINKWKNNTEYDGWCYYANNPDNGEKYGVLYQWEAAKHACPVGWHLPTNNEWDKLINHLGGEKVAGGKLKATYGWNRLNKGATNSSNFSALPGGYRYFDGSFDYLSLYCYWWSVTEYNNNHAYYRYLDYISTKVFRYNYVKLSGFSVRCVRD